MSIDASVESPLATDAPTWKPLKASCKRVLVVAIDHHLGNTVLMLPVIAAMAEYFDAGLDVLVDARYTAFVERVPHTNRVWRYPPQRKDGRKAKSKNAIAEAKLLLGINRRRYHAVIDATGNIRSTTIVATLALRGVTRRFGFADGRRTRVYSHKIVPPDIRAAHVKHRYAALLRAIDAAGRSEYPEGLRLTPSAAGQAEADAALRSVFGEAALDRAAKGLAPIVVMHPAAGIAWRQWPAERFGAVAGRLVREAGARVAIIGTPQDRELAEAVRAASNEPDAVRFTPVSLEGLLGLYARSAAIVSNESGPTHLAALTDLPIVTIFGPTPELQWRPVRDHACTVLRGAACDPGCQGRTCVADLKCLTELSVDAVADAALAAVAAPAPA